MLAGQPTSPSTLATNTTPAVSDPSLRSGRRRGLSQLYNHLIHIHHAPNPGSDPSSPALPSHRPRPGRSLTSPSAATSPNPQPQAQDDRSSPVPSDSEPRARAQSSSRRPRMLPIVNSQAFQQMRPSRSAEPTPVADLASFLGTSAPLAPTASQPAGTASAGSLPSIQFIPASDPTRARPSLDFRRITRVLPNASSVIRVGRYSERDSATEPNPSAPSDSPIGFKSKVVSRRHCEFFFSCGQWYIKDVKSSSGTFLNHIRLSQPGIESRPFPINDGDTVQLGIDFKGGEEMIFRCVKIRIETNRGWQRGLNKFNKSTHKQLQALAKGRSSKDGDTASKYSTDCTICLNSIAPCQALFVAPCSHTWHFKCIRQILEQSVSGQFLCPNCRALADLDADVDEELEDFEDDEDDEEDEEFEVVNDEARRSQGLDDSEGDSGAAARVADDASDDGESSPDTGSNMEQASNEAVAGSNSDGVSTTRSPRLGASHGFALNSLDDAISRIGVELDANTTAVNGVPRVSISSPRPIPGSGSIGGTAIARARTNTTRSEFSDSGMSDGLGPSSPGRNALEGLRREGPMTPRNTAGPFVFDGGVELNGAGEHGNSSSDEARRR